MGLTPEEIRRAKLAKNNKEKGIVPRASSVDLSKLKHGLSNKNDIDERIKTLTAYSIESLSSKLAEMKKQTVEVVFLFDKSESCTGTEAETIRGFERIISKEKKEGYNDLVTTVLFNHDVEVVHSRQPLNKIGRLYYQAEGGTALYDTLCTQLTEIYNRQKLDREKPKKTLVVIMTDGQDIHSCQHTLEDTRTLITFYRSQGWEFIFLGAMIDTKNVAASLGIKPENAEVYSLYGIKHNFSSIEKALEDIHEGGEVKEDWSEPIKQNRPSLPSASEEHGKVRRLNRGN